jgi:probable F420-dependent oxidoreductase
MQIGVIYPQVEFGNDPSAIRDYAQTAEGLGYTHILAYEHVLGANPDRPGGLKGPYTYQSPFMEPLLLFTYMAAFTHRIGYATGILVLPQRQTALVAKQTASLDILCGGRFRLGVGIGWNAPEYTALGYNFSNRGRRIEEQIEILRLLWTQPLVNYIGRWHEIPDAGINPLPIQRPIPIWFGGHAEPVVRRAARLGDGWLPNYRTPAEARAPLEFIRRELEAAGRDPKTFGVEVRLPFGDGNPEPWIALIQGWEAVGATHLTLNTMSSGLDSSNAHIKAIEYFAQEVGLQKTNHG